MPPTAVLQVPKALPQLRGGVRVEITAHGDDGRAVRGWWRTATEAPWRPPCLVSDVASWDTTGHSARRTAGGIGPAVRLSGGSRPYVGGLGALGALRDVEFDGLALFQRAVALDGAGVHEHVVARLGLDEAVALVGVEPLDGSNSHGACPPPSARRFDHTGARRHQRQGTSSTVLRSQT